MKSDFSTTDPSEMLDLVLPRLESSAATAVVVVQDGHVVGMVTTENIGEFVMMEAALRKARNWKKAPA
jgi:predicted transcriptional regulator